MHVDEHLLCSQQFCIVPRCTASLLHCGSKIHVGGLYKIHLKETLFQHNIAHLTRLSSKLNPSAFVLMPQLCYIHLWLLREFPEGI